MMIPKHSRESSGFSNRSRNGNGSGRSRALRRVSAYRRGPKVKPRSYSVHSETPEVHSIGKVLLVFSTREKPSQEQAVKVQKIRMTNRKNWASAEGGSGTICDGSSSCFSRNSRAPWDSINPG
jgi:hypothetical protein